MSELNPDFRSDDDVDINDPKAAIAWLDDASVDFAEKVRRADVVERLENGRSGRNRDEVVAAIGRARGEGAPAPTHDETRSESHGPRQTESRSSKAKDQPR